MIRNVDVSKLAYLCKVFYEPAASFRKFYLERQGLCKRQGLGQVMTHLIRLDAVVEKDPL